MEKDEKLRKLENGVFYSYHDRKNKTYRDRAKKILPLIFFFPYHDRKKNPIMIGKLSLGGIFRWEKNLFFPILVDRVK